MTDDTEVLLDAITALIPRLLVTMDALEQVQRNMHPPRLDELSEFLKPFEESLKTVSEDFLTTQFPDHLRSLKAQMDQAIEYSMRACDGILNHEAGIGQVMKAMRAACRVQEIIYPLANVMRPVSQYYLEPEARQNADLVTALSEGSSRANIGIMNAQNSRDQRGGFSLYVPENLNPKDTTPEDTEPRQKLSIVIALHGGSGHGADFLWSWLREARSRGFILLAPTSRQNTWSLMGEELDLQNLLSMLNYVRENWNIDEDHILLTGMSDGATYSLLAGLQKDSPFTHLAPFSGVLHPEISMTGNMVHARDKPVYLVHGKLDWMFPIETAYMAQEELLKAGAQLTFRDIDNLSHNYARAENPDLLAWFNPELKIQTK